METLNEIALWLHYQRTERLLVIIFFFGHLLVKDLPTKVRLSVVGIGLCMALPSFAYRIGDPVLHPIVWDGPWAQWVALVSGYSLAPLALLLLGVFRWILSTVTLEPEADNGWGSARERSGAGAASDGPGARRDAPGRYDTSGPPGVAESHRPKMVIASASAVGRVFRG